MIVRASKYVDSVAVDQCQSEQFRCSSYYSIDFLALKWPGLICAVDARTAALIFVHSSNRANKVHCIRRGIHVRNGADTLTDAGKAPGCPGPWLVSWTRHIYGSIRTFEAQKAALK